MGLMLTGMPLEKSSPVLEVKNLSKSFDGRIVIGPLSFALSKGECLCVEGPSGSGKTTLLRLIAGLERPDGGTISIDSATVSGNGVLTPPHERGLSLVFQDLALWPHLRVDRQIEFVARDSKLSTEERRRRVETLLDLVRLDDHRGKRPADLSGGERQRLAIARALAADARLLLFDEPFAHLDGSHRDRIITHLLELKNDGYSLLIAAHDASLLDKLSDNVISLDDRGASPKG